MTLASDTLRMSPCDLCPRMCGANRLEGERGACGASGVLVVARAALHFWEEPPLSGASGSGTVFFANCPLKCAYCQNHVIANGDAGSIVSVERLAALCLDLQSQGALNVNFVTPTHYSLAIAQAVAIARRNGLTLPVVWNTSGYERVAAVRSLADTVDVWLADFKYSDAELGKRYSHVDDYPIVALAAIEEMAAVAGPPVMEGANGQERMSKGVIVRHLVLPGALEQSKQALALLHERLGDDVLYSIMNQYTPVMDEENARRLPELASRVSDEEYEELLDYADSIGMDGYFWQQGPASEESFIPDWDFEG